MVKLRIHVGRFRAKGVFLGARGSEVVKTGRKPDRRRRGDLAPGKGEEPRGAD